LIACVASGFRGLSAGLKHFLIFGRAKIGGSAKKVLRRHARSEKRLERVEKPTETLPTQASYLKDKDHRSRKMGGGGGGGGV